VLSYFLDQDGTGTAWTGTRSAFVQPRESTAAIQGGDCDDGDDAVHRGVEVCSARTRLRRQHRPEGTPGCQTFFLDADGDGTGSKGAKCFAALVAGTSPRPGTATMATGRSSRRG